MGWEISDIGWMAWPGASRGTRRTNGVAGGGELGYPLKTLNFTRGIGTLGKEKQEKSFLLSMIYYFPRPTGKSFQLPASS